MSKKIWVIDDDPSICEAIKIILEGTGHTVIVFDTASTVLHSLTSTKPDILISDVLLINESGIDLSKKIKNNVEYKDLPLILMSATPLDESDFNESKATAFLRKPFDIYELVDLINAQK